MKKGLMVGVFAGLILVVGSVFFLLKQGVTPSFGLESYEVIKHASDVIGSRTVTTTVGVNFAPSGATVGGLIPSATSTYVDKIGQASIAVYTVQAKEASSTSRIDLEIQGSYDDECDTTATSDGNLPLTSEINWFAAGDHMRGKAQSTAWINSSSTNYITWSNPMSGSGKQIILENLDYECLRLLVSGVSTTIWTQLGTR